MNNSRGRKNKSLLKAADECTLCRKSSVHLVNFEALGEKEKEYIIKHHGKELPSNSLICKAHYMEAKRKYSDGNHIPKWAQQAAQAANVKLATCLSPVLRYY